MAYRFLQFDIPASSQPQIENILQEEAVAHRSFFLLSSETSSMRVEVATKKEAVQSLTDRLLHYFPHLTILILPMQSLLPKAEEEPASQKAPKEEKKFLGISREELHDTLASEAQLDRTYLAMVTLSTFVATIGLLTNNVAVIIGAMVIAPFLGPNLSLAFATALGDLSLLYKSTRTLITGLLLCTGLSYVMGALWPSPLITEELLSRTQVGVDGLVLAAASGMAAVLSLVSGVSNALVGVMVAVALLPPTATMGLMLGAAHLPHALGAALLLAGNIVCLNLSAQTLLILKGVSPRTWWEKQQAKQIQRWQSLFWLLSLLLILFLIAK